jgi:hypothetical protein
VFDFHLPVSPPCFASAFQLNRTQPCPAPSAPEWPHTRVRPLLAFGSTPPPPREGREQALGPGRQPVCCTAMTKMPAQKHRRRQLTLAAWLLAAWCNGEIHDARALSAVCACARK